MSGVAGKLKHQNQHLGLRTISLVCVIPKFECLKEDLGIFFKLFLNLFLEIGPVLSVSCIFKHTVYV